MEFHGQGCEDWSIWTLLGVGTQAKKGRAICVFFMPIFWVEADYNGHLDREY